MSKITTLAIDATTKSASVALIENEVVLTEHFLNNGLTHSQNLMPMIENVLSLCNNPIIDEIAVTVGPGSFTGVRIAVSCVKGLSIVNDIPCKAVSAMEALAFNFIDEKGDAIICSLSDARCGRAYTALFELKDSTITRLTEDDCKELCEIEKEISIYKDKLILTGDGSELFVNQFAGYSAFLSSKNKKLIKASSVYYASVNKMIISADSLQPMYMQLPQAQRELNAKRKL